jgi:hypothetical protein
MMRSNTIWELIQIEKDRKEQEEFQRLVNANLGKSHGTVHNILKKMDDYNGRGNR